jgi:monothiol glutaredoxin
MPDVDHAGEETHDDFKPKHKAPTEGDAASMIQSDISTNSVFLYMKGTPDAPMCGFSRMACAILNAYGVKFGTRNVLSDEDLRDGVKKFTGWPTIPQVFFEGEFVGGCDILKSLHENGELEKLVEKINAK